jgi:CRP-like cAMP-binding protein
MSSTSLIVDKGKVDVDAKIVESDSDDYSGDEETIDPFKSIPLKDRVTKMMRKLIGFFRNEMYRKKFIKSLWAGLLNYYVEPDSSERFLMNILMVIIILWNIATVPYACCLETMFSEGVRIINITTDVIAWLNLSMQLLQAVEYRGELIKKRKESLKACLTPWFLIELLTYIAITDYFITSPWARISRILGILFFAYYFISIEQIAHKIPYLDVGPIVIRFAKLLLYFLIAFHVFACLFVFSASLEHKYGNYALTNGGQGLDLLIRDVFILPFNENDGNNIRRTFRQYVGGLFVSVLYIVGFGAAMPQNEIDVVYALGTVFTGIILVSTSTSVFISLIYQIGASEEAYNQKIQDIKSFLAFRNVNEELQKDIFNYFDIIQKSGRGLDLEYVMGDLELATKRSIAQYLHRDIVSQVPFFQQMGEMFIQEICQYLKHTLLLKGYRIVNKGEVGKEMFFIGSGSVEVISEDGEIVFAKLEKGKFFGEIALLSADARRTASIRAAELCEVFVLTKEDFEKVTSRYPDAKRILQEEIDKRNQANVSIKDKLEKGKKKMSSLVRIGSKFLAN